MSALDLAVLATYIAGTVWLGLVLSRGQSTVRYYFTSGRQAPWGVVMASIVATETSTVTVVSLPGFAFGTDLTFLQLVFGYLVGRVIVTLLFIPGYFRGEYLTALPGTDGAFRRGRRPDDGHDLSCDSQPGGRVPAVRHRTRVGGTAADRPRRPGHRVDAGTLA